jgi:EAL domain-containing protein (putative c-di-GMP-specific phosphodiesterase class I)/GGDEF domain-containing protein
MDRYAYRTLIILHLQNFNELHQFFGKNIGDSLLQQFGLWLKRMNDNAYPLGSADFAVLIEEEYSHQHMESYSEHFFEQLAKHSFTAGLENVSLRVQMGVHTGDLLSLAHADTALQTAIATSHPFALYEGHDHLEAQQQHNIITAKNIREAFHAGRILCYYQPIISTLTGAVEKYETLARLQDIDNTILPPHDFLTIAQKTRLYPQISQEVIRQSCEAFRNRDESFTVHLCALDVVNDVTIRFIEDIITTTNTASRIIFELCEEDIYENFLPVSLFIQHMKRLGAKIAIDNFGNNYTHFDKMIHLDIDYLKIDGSLISKIIHSPRHAKIIGTIASFSNAIGAKSIAENVETAEILEQVKTMGIHFAQGYHIGKPGPSPFPKG